MTLYVTFYNVFHNCDNLLSTTIGFGTLSSQGLFTPSDSGSGSCSGSEDIDLYLYHSHHVSVAVAVAAALLTSKHQMGSGPIFPAMPLPLYWISFDFSYNVDVK